MTENQEKMFKLLKELTEICEKNNIKYSLDKKLLFDALNNKEISDDYCDFSIIIDGRDVEKLTSLVEKKENRIIESLKNNKNMPGLYLRYVDTSSLFFKLNDYGKIKYHGFSITINPIIYKNKNKKKAKYNDILFKGIERLNCRTTKNGIKGLIYACYIILLSIFGKKRLAKKIYKKLYIDKNVNYKNAYYFKNTGKIEKYKEIFSVTKKTTINNNNFYYIDNESFIENRLSKINALNLKEKYGKDIINKDISYVDYFKECKKNKVHFKKYFFLQTLNSYNNYKIKKYKKYVKHCWDIMYRTRDRFELYDYYMPLKKEIIELYNDNKFDELKQILQKYINLLEYNYSKGLCLVFDPVIFDITKEVLLRDNKKTFVNKLNKLAPKEHLIPMEL